MVGFNWTPREKKHTKQKATILEVSPPRNRHPFGQHDPSIGAACQVGKVGNGLALDRAEEQTVAVMIISFLRGEHELETTWPTAAGHVCECMLACMSVESNFSAWFSVACGPHIGGQVLQEPCTSCQGQCTSLLRSGRDGHQAQKKFQSRIPPKESMTFESDLQASLKAFRSLVECQPAEALILTKTGVSILPASWGYQSQKLVGGFP